MAITAEKIVIAVDDSNFAEYAFDWYFSHIHSAGNEVILVYCLEIASMPSREYWELHTKEAVAKGKRVEEKFSSKCQEHGVQPKYISDFNKPGEFICQMAKEQNASLIVVGTRGMGKIRRTILGSVSDYVLHHANCPVMVVRK